MQDYYSNLIILSLLAGAAIPAGGLLGAFTAIYPGWLNEEWKHGIMAFGGGALLSAVALVLAPDGLVFMDSFWAIFPLLLGGFVFGLIDFYLSRKGGSASQLLAMMLDFVPEAMALGAALILQSGSAGLIAFLIAIQNLPEAFNAFREIRVRTPASRAKLLWSFAAIALVGPLSALVGAEVLAEKTYWLGFVMLFGSGGILFITFRDIAPQARLDKHWLPSMGAVIGFALGVVGYLME